MEPIDSVEARVFRLPLDEPLQDANHGLQTFFELITATIRLSDGSEGTGYSYTVGKGGRAIKALIDHDMTPLLKGRSPEDIDALYDLLQLDLHYVGRGGLVSFAISAIDIALWDLRGKATGQPLWRMAGGTSSKAKAYRGGVDLNFPLPKLVESVQGHLERGYRAVKIKVGKPDIEEDVRRIAAVRDALGADVPLMVDANYAYDLDRAKAAARAFEPFGLVWLEEPMAPDAFADYGALAAATSIPLAMGENLHTQAEFDLALTHSGLGFIQPDASNCGGVTGWLRAARAAALRGLPVCSHGMQELHVSLLAAQPNPGWLEVHSFPIDRYARTPLRMQDGMGVAPDAPGTGVLFDWARLEAAHLA